MFEVLLSRPLQLAEIWTLLGPATRRAMDLVLHLKAHSDDLHSCCLGALVRELADAESWPVAAHRFVGSLFSWLEAGCVTAFRVGSTLSWTLEDVGWYPCRLLSLERLWHFRRSLLPVTHSFGVIGCHSLVGVTGVRRLIPSCFEEVGHSVPLLGFVVLPLLDSWMMTNVARSRSPTADGLDCVGSCGTADFACRLVRWLAVVLRKVEELGGSDGCTAKGNTTSLALETWWRS